MTLTTNIITLRRTDISEVMCAIYRTLPFDSALKSTLVSVFGPAANGKKIVADSAVEEFLGRSPGPPLQEINEELKPVAFEGKLESNEYWRGESRSSKTNGTPIEIDFMNAVLNQHEFSNHLSGIRKLDARIEAFLNQRVHPGLSFIHNAQDTLKNPAIEVFLKNQGSCDVLRDHFRELAVSHRQWLRSIRIEIKDEALAQERDLINVFRHLNQGVSLIGSNDNAQAEERMGAISERALREVPIYGVNIPRF